jgi:hypothetical protein
MGSRTTNRKTRRAEVVPSYYWRRICIGDRRRDVILGYAPSMEGQTVLDGPWDSADTAMRHSLASSEYLAFSNVELVLDPRPMPQEGAVQ